MILGADSSVFSSSSSGLASSTIFSESLEAPDESDEDLELPASEEEESLSESEEPEDEEIDGDRFLVSFDLIFRLPLSLAFISVLPLWGCEVLALTVSVLGAAAAATPFFASDGFTTI